MSHHSKNARKGRFVVEMNKITIVELYYNFALCVVFAKSFRRASLLFKEQSVEVGQIVESARIRYLRYGAGGIIRHFSYRIAQPYVIEAVDETFAGM